MVRLLVVASMLAIAATSIWALVSSPRLAHAASSVCTVGEPAGTSCSDALYRFGYPA